MSHIDDIEIGPLLHLPVWGDAGAFVYDEDEERRKSE